MMANSTQTLKLFLLGVVAAVLLLSGTALSESQKCRKGGKCDKTTDPSDDEAVWLVHFTGGPSRWNYWDPITGELRGYYIDVLNAVCRIAEKNCLPVHDISSNCWDTSEFGEIGGFGLFNFYYDACIGWNPTYTRLRTFQFSKAVRQNSASGFIVKPGNPEGFDHTNLSEQKIGFIDGFFSSPECVARSAETYEQGSTIPEDNIVYYGDLDSLIQGVLNAEVVAGFDREALHENMDTGVDYLAESNVYCSPDGPALMMRKDNQMKGWFDDAWDELVASDEYGEICARIDNEHVHVPGPDSGDVCL